MPDDDSSGRRAASGFALTFALVFPTLITWLYFVALRGSPSTVQQGAYLAGKTIQFCFPAFWVIVVLRAPVRWSRPSSAGLVAGLLFGAVVLIAMLALYGLVLKPAGLFDVPAARVLAKVRSLEIDSVWKYSAVGVFYTVFHSLLEEYYWRWFVYSQSRRMLSFRLSLIISSIGFMAHHVILLATFFGPTAPETYLFALAVAVGGAAWAWIYERSGQLYGPWLSHLLVDAAIFLIGYDLVRDQLF